MTAVESRSSAVLMAAQEDRKQTTPQKQSVSLMYKGGVRSPSRWSDMQTSDVTLWSWPPGVWSAQQWRSVTHSRGSDLHPLALPYENLDVKAWDGVHKFVQRSSFNDETTLKFADFIHLFHVSASVWSKRLRVCEERNSALYCLIKPLYTGNQFYFYTGSKAPALLIGIRNLSLWVRETLFPPSIVTGGSNTRGIRSLLLVSQSSMAVFPGC